MFLVLNGRIRFNVGGLVPSATVVVEDVVSRPLYSVSRTGRMGSESLVNSVFPVLFHISNGRRVVLTVMNHRRGTGREIGSFREGYG